ncbi:MAG: TIGR02444 family protein [Pseudaminobacter sp.]
MTDIFEELNRDIAKPMRKRVNAQDKLEAAVDLWTFAVRLYDEPEVATACLALQEDAGIDVPVLLFGAWLGMEKGVVLDAARLAMVEAAVGEWHGQVVQTLRALRRQLKREPHPAPSESTDRLRERIKASELEAERIELAELARLFEEWPTTGNGNVARATANMQLVIASPKMTETARLGPLIAALEKMGGFKRKSRRERR